MPNIKEDLLQQVKIIRKMFPLLRKEKDPPRKELGKAINELIDAVASANTNNQTSLPNKVSIDEGFNGYPGKTERKYSELEKDLNSLIDTIEKMN